MKTFLKKITFLALTAVIMFTSTSCEKDKDDVVGKESQLVGSWVTIGMTINPGLPNPNGGSPITDMYSQMSACDKDNFITLKKDGNYHVEEGATRCDESNPAIVETGKWVLNTAGTIISVTPVNDAPYEFELVNVGKGYMKLNRLERFNGVNYVMTLNFRLK